MPTLLWFRRDLRLRDLPALLDAADADGEVLACYVLDPRLKASSGPRRLQYLYDALRELQDALDGRLIVTRGRPEKRIPALAKAVDASAVHVSADFTPFGTRRDDAVRDALGDIPLEASGSPYLVSPGPGDEGRRRRRTRCSRRSTRMAGTRLAGAGQDRARSPHAGSTRRTSRAGSTSPMRVSNSNCPQAKRRRCGSGRSSSTRASPTTPTTVTAPTSTRTSRMSAHLKFGTIHPRTMAADLGSGQGRTGVPAGVGLSRLLRGCAQRMARQRVVELEQVLRRDADRRGRRGEEGRSRRGRPGAPAFRSSTQGCASSPRPAGCTTGCG